MIANGAGGAEALAHSKFIYRFSTESFTKVESGGKSFDKIAKFSKGT